MKRQQWKLWCVAAAFPGCATPDSASPKGPETTNEATGATSWTDPAADDDWSDLIGDIPGAGTQTPEDITATIQHALDYGVPSAGEALDAYNEAYAMGDESCPGSAFMNGFEVFGTCTAASGAQFSGVAGFTLQDNRVWDGDTWTGSVSLLTSPADYVIFRPDGTYLLAGGGLNFTRTIDASGTQQVTAIRGTFVDTSREDWLGIGYSGELLIGLNQRTGGYPDLMVDGALTLGSTSLQLDDLHVIPYECASGFMGGTIQVRQADATWVTVTLPNTCTNCGQATSQNGEDIGQVCIDPTPVHDLSTSWWNP